MVCCGLFILVGCYCSLRFCGCLGIDEYWPGVKTEPGCFKATVGRVPIVRELGCISNEL
jgi:hypothetical protein